MAEAETKEAHTPGPWTTEPGRFWVCNVGNNLDDPGVWSAFPVPDGQPFPFGDKAADARLIAAAPDQYAVGKELDRLSLVIESAVRNAYPAYRDEVLALIKANRAAIQRAEA